MHFLAKIFAGVAEGWIQRGHQPVESLSRMSPCDPGPFELRLEGARSP